MKTEHKHKHKLFTPDYSKKKFTIIIDVCDNCNVVKTEGDATYQEMIGALEIIKRSLIVEQTKINKSVAKTQKKHIDSACKTTLKKKSTKK